jgi:hypothetical protein
MPTGSKRLHARAAAYAHAAESLYLDWTGDATEYEEGERLAIRLEDTYHRLTKLAEEQEKKEQEREQRRKDRSQEI